MKDIIRDYKHFFAKKSVFQIDSRFELGRAIQERLIELFPGSSRMSPAVWSGKIKYLFGYLTASDLMIITWANGRPPNGDHLQWLTLEDLYDIPKKYRQVVIGNTTLEITNEQYEELKQQLCCKE